VKGHPWLALIALAAAMALIGTAAGVILQEGRFELTPGQATIVFIVGMLATLPGGLALLVLGPLVALTTSGDAFDRVINGGVIAGFGGERDLGLHPTPPPQPLVPTKLDEVT
jgi:hypothetical protein